MNNSSPFLFYFVFYVDLTFVMCCLIISNTMYRLNYCIHVIESMNGWKKVFFVSLEFLFNPLNNNRKCVDSWTYTVLTYQLLDLYAK